MKFFRPACHRSAIYMHEGLSPPSQLHGAVRHWLGLAHGEILAAIDRHFAEHRRSYVSGSGDDLLYLVEAEIRKAWQARHQVRDRTDDDPERPRRRAGSVQKIHNAGGRPDVFVEGRAARLVRDQAGPVERRRAFSDTNPPASRGNITGITNAGNLLAAKRLELLRELVPVVNLFGVLANPNSPNTAFETKELQAAADVLGVRLLIVNAATPDEFGIAFATLTQQQAGALLVTGDALFNRRHDELIALAARYALPTMYRYRFTAEAGGLMSYTADFADNYRQAGGYIGRILKGERPADLPVQQASKVELIINLKTAKTLGITFPSALLVRADRVIE